MKFSNIPHRLILFLLISNLSSCFFTYEAPNTSISSLCYELERDCFVYKEDQYSLSNCKKMKSIESKSNINLFYPQFSEMIQKPEPGYSILMGGLRFFFLKSDSNPQFNIKIPADVFVSNSIEVNSDNLNKYNANFWFIKKIPEINTSGIQFFELNDFCVFEKNGVILNFPINSNHSSFNL